MKSGLPGATSQWMSAGFVDGYHVKVRPEVVVHHELVFRLIEISKVEGGHEEARSVDVLARLQQL